MLVKEIKKFELDPSQILGNPANERLMESLGRFAAKIGEYGYKVPVSSKQSLIKLGEIPDGKKVEIAQAFDLWLQWIDPAEDGDSAERTEKAFLKRALQHYGFHVGEEFWTTFNEDQFVQIYGEDMIQLYRSLNFFNVCGYSLLDISVFEWYVLWDRPRRILDEMFRCSREVLDKNIPVIKFDAPRHVLRETYDTGLSDMFVPRASLVDFCYIASVTKSPLAGAPPRGFVCTTTGHIIATGDEALRIQLV